MARHAGRNLNEERSSSSTSPVPFQYIRFLVAPDYTAADEAAAEAAEAAGCLARGCSAAAGAGGTVMLCHRRSGGLSLRRPTMWRRRRKPGATSSSAVEAAPPGAGAEAAAEADPRDIGRCRPPLLPPADGTHTQKFLLGRIFSPLSLVSLFSSLAWEEERGGISQISRRGISCLSSGLSTVLPTTMLVCRGKESSVSS